MNSPASQSPVTCNRPYPHGRSSLQTRLTTGFDSVMQSRFVAGISLALATRAPRLALQGGAILGRFRHRLSGQPHWQDIQKVLGQIPAPQAKAIARQMAIHWQKNQVLCNLICLRGLECLYPLLRCEGAERLLEMHRQNQPAILLFPHIGPSFMAMAGLASLNFPILLFNALDNGFRYPDNVESWRHSESSDNSALFLKQAVDRLKRGHVVAMAFDGSAGDTKTPIPFMGDIAYFQRGMIALHRLSGAAIIPVSAHWQADGYIGVTIHPPLSLPNPSEGTAESRGNAILVAAAAWLESCMRTRPEGLNQKSLRWLLTLRTSSEISHKT